MKTESPKSQCTAHSLLILSSDCLPRNPCNQQQKRRHMRANIWRKVFTTPWESPKEYRNQMAPSSHRSTPTSQWCPITKDFPQGAKKKLQELCTGRNQPWRRLRPSHLEVSQRYDRIAHYSTEWRWRARSSLEQQASTVCTTIQSTEQAMRSATKRAETFSRQFTILSTCRSTQTLEWRSRQEWGRLAFSRVKGLLWKSVHLGENPAYQTRIVSSRQSRRAVRK